MTERFRWKNCRADVSSWSYGQTAQAFLDIVVKPSLDGLTQHLDKLSQSDDPVALFEKNDTEELQRTTTMAFVLSIQSMWERQIRAYLRSCAEEIRTNIKFSKTAIEGNWPKLDSLFFDLRGIRIRDFDEYSDLDLLHLLGNTCRHGDGPSARKLWKRRPDLWPHQQIQPSIDSIVIPRDLILSFVQAIVSFWNEVEYIYLESLERKHVSVKKKLMAMRRHRAKRKSRYWQSC